MAVDYGSREERWSLAGATALVTGGSKGIGHAMVEELAGFGARVHTCSRNAAELEECRRRWEEKNLQVNNAGQLLFKPTAECTAEEYSNLMTTNLESSFHLSQLARPLLIHASIAGGGSIINMSSIGGSIGFAGSVIYAITKGTSNVKKRLTLWDGGSTILSVQPASKVHPLLNCQNILYYLENRGGTIYNGFFYRCWL
uniref:Tropinone reductase-like protein n=1 Tax=Aegilops tauschii subsp. strangulata TaxID=200361 RepID=A0A453IZL2_AEGTS